MRLQTTVQVEADPSPGNSGLHDPQQAQLPLGLPLLTSSPAEIIEEQGESRPRSRAAPPSDASPSTRRGLARSLLRKNSQTRTSCGKSPPPTTCT